MDHALLLLDTGPIRELVNYRAVHILGFETLRSQLKYFLDSAHFERFGSFLAPFRQKVTTTSVIVELHHWIRRTESAGHSKIWSLVFDEFRAMGLEEQSVKLLQMRSERVGRYGPTDCSVFHLAEQSFSLKPVILTIDSRFQVECLAANIKARLLEEIVAG